VSEINEKNKDIDVTDQVYFGQSDDESLPLTKCVCGKEHEPWDVILHIERDDISPCDNCGRKLYWRGTIKVYEVVE